MAGGWSTSVRVGAMVVAVAVGGLLTEVRAEDDVAPFWPPRKDMEIKVQDMFRTPPDVAAKRLHEFLTGSKDTRAGLESVFGMYLPSPDVALALNNTQCLRDLLAYIRILSDPTVMGEMLQKGHFWPYMMPDSWGKVPDGILYGNIMPWGMQEECTMIDADDHFDTTPAINAKFRGRYCLVSVMPTATGKSLTGLKELDQTLMRPDLTAGIAMTIRNFPITFTYGTCMPSSCTADNLKTSINNILNPVGKQALHIDCHVADEPNNYNAGDIIYIVFMSVLGVAILCGAIVDLCINYYEKHELRKGPLKFLLAFSAYTNMKNTFAIKVNEHPDVIRCLHGMRVFTMAWVVWVHGYIMQASVTSNLVHIKELSAGFLNQIIVNGSYCVDTFLFMSGLLVTYSILMEMEKNHHINWILYYVHRLIRLSPPILIIAAGAATVFRFGLVGPFGGNIERSFVEGCRGYWFADTFFFGNFYDTVVCLPQCWYTAVDTQLYIVAPIVLIPLLSKKKPALAWLGLITLVSVAIPMIVVGVYNLTPEGMFIPMWEEPERATVDTYRKPWTRAPPYIVGIWTGWLIMQVRGKKFKMHPVAVVVGWLASTAIALAVLFGMMDYNVMDFNDPKEIPQAVSIVYSGLSRFAWGVSLMWVVFACHTGYGGIVNSILSHPSLQPMSRLTYCLYLTTIPVQIIYAGSIFLPLYVDHLNKIIETCGYLFIGGIMAILLTLAVERPILALEKLLLPRPGRGLMDQKLEQKKES